MPAGGVGIDRGGENANLRQPSIRFATLCPDNPELLLDCDTAHALAGRLMIEKNNDAIARVNHGVARQKAPCGAAAKRKGRRLWDAGSCRRWLSAKVVNGMVMR
jgi:hypothetical protein